MTFHDFSKREKSKNQTSPEYSGEDLKKQLMENLRTKINELQSCIGKTDESSRKRFDALLTELQSHADDADVQAALSALMTDGLAETKQDIDKLRTQIENEYEILPLSYIAKHYFHKSRAWLYQRLNGLEVKGHTYALNEEQKKIFNLACQDISKRIGSVCLV